MKRFCFISIIVLLQFSNIFGAVVNDVVAVVGSEPITRDEFMSRKNFLLLQARSAGQKLTDADVYKDLVEERIMILKLKELDYEIEDSDIEKRLTKVAEQYKLTLDEFRKQIERDGVQFKEYKAIMKKQIAMESLYGTVITPPEITDAEADEFYLTTKNKEQFEGDTVARLSWIFLKASTFKEKGEKKELANKIKTDLNRGVDFAKLASIYSDDTATKSNGGDLGYNLLVDLNLNKKMPSHVKYGLDLVKKGSKSGTVSRVRETVGRGFWIVKITDIQKDQNSIRSRVKSYLLEKRSQESFIEWLDLEIKKMSVTIYPTMK